MPPESFYIVWNPNSLRAPKVRHDEFEDASAEAARLAAANPGNEFFVMAARRSVAVPPAVIVTDFVDFEVPF